MDICGWTIQRKGIKTQLYVSDYSGVLVSSLIISFSILQLFIACVFNELKEMLTSAVFLILLSVQGVQGQVEGLS